jgi:hypothetical protein
MAAVLEYLRARPKAAYREVADAVGKYGHKIYPVVYGRAQALLGIVRMKKRGKGRGPKRTREIAIRPAARIVRRGRRTRTATGAADQLKTFLADYEALRRERDEMRAALEAARRAISPVLTSR